MGNAKYKKTHRENGLCIECSRPAVPGRIRCAIHLQSKANRERKWRKENPETHARLMKEKKQYRRENGRCINCGAPLDSSNVTCSNCSGHIHPPMGVPIFKHKTMGDRFANNQC